MRLQDVATRANVSVATVSKILNNSPEAARIPDATQQRVLEACAALEYRPNYLGRSLKTGRAHAIGAVLLRPNSASHMDFFWMPMILGVVEESFARSSHVVSLGAENGRSVIETGLDAISQRRIDGLIIGSAFCSPEEVARLEAANVPVVLASWRGQTVLPVVDIDERSGVEAGISHLHELGHKNVLWLGATPKNPMDDTVRFSAFKGALKTRKMKGERAEVDYPHRALPLESQFEEVRESLENSEAFWAHFEGENPKTALFCYNETLAFGAVRALKNRGLRVPEDVSVLAFDDILAPMCDPALTVLSHEQRQMGVRAVQILHEIVQKPDAHKNWRGQRESLPCELFVRNSTARSRFA